MDCPKIPMSYDEFDTMEHLLGWKTEYWDGCAHLSPREMGIETRLALPASSSVEPSLEAFISITPDSSYSQQIIDGYIASFINSVEFCGWPTDRIFEEAHDDIALYFGNKRGKPLSASVILLEPETQWVIATALVTDKSKQGACLELLYVRPPYQRQGIGSHIIRHITHTLSKQGYSQLASRYHICNFQSRQFYHKLGFQDVRDRYTLPTYIAWLRNEIHRKESLKMLDGIEEMKQEQKQLRNKLDRLEEEFAQSIREALEEAKSLKPEVH